MRPDSYPTKKPLKSIYWLQNIFFKDVTPKGQYIDLNGLIICNDNNLIVFDTRITAQLLLLATKVMALAAVLEFFVR